MGHVFAFWGSRTIRIVYLLASFVDQTRKLGLGITLYEFKQCNTWPVSRNLIVRHKYWHLVNLLWSWFWNVETEKHCERVRINAILFVLVFGHWQTYACTLVKISHLKMVYADIVIIFSHSNSNLVFVAQRDAFYHFPLSLVVCITSSSAQLNSKDSQKPQPTRKKIGHAKHNENENDQKAANTFEYFGWSITWPYINNQSKPRNGYIVRSFRLTFLIRFGNIVAETCRMKTF